MRKKYIILLLAMLGFSMGIEAKSINTYGFTIGAGQTREFYIYMNTTRNNLVSFQIDLKMPKGLTVNIDKCLLPSRVTDTEQQLYVGLVGNNLYRLVSTSFNFKPLPMENAPLVKVSVTADETFQGGTVNLVDMFTVTTNGDKVPWISDSFEVVKGNNIKGDANYDGIVSVTDLMQIVGYALGQDGLYSSSYDVDLNGLVDVVDVMIVSDTLLGK